MCLSIFVASFNRRIYNPGQKSFGQYCNIHIFLSFLGSLLKQCILFEIFLQFSLPPPDTKLKLGKILDTRVQHCLWGEGRGWTCVNWKTPQKRKSVPRLLAMIVALLFFFFILFLFFKLWDHCNWLTAVVVSLPN